MRGQGTRVLRYTWGHADFLASMISKAALGPVRLLSTSKDCMGRLMFMSSNRATRRLSLASNILVLPCASQLHAVIWSSALCNSSPAAGRWGGLLCRRKTFNKTPNMHQDKRRYARACPQLGRVPPTDRTCEFPKTCLTSSFSHSPGYRNTGKPFRRAGHTAHAAVLYTTVAWMWLTTAARKHVEFEPFNAWTCKPQNSRALTLKKPTKASP